MTFKKSNISIMLFMLLKTFYLHICDSHVEKNGKIRFSGNNLRPGSQNLLKHLQA